MECGVRTCWWTLVGVMVLISKVCWSHQLLDHSTVHTDDVSEDLIKQVGMGEIAKLYLPVSVQPESSCGQALANMSASLGDMSSPWALRMVDSWGKNNDGLMAGLIKMDGMYDECVTSASTDHTITGKYCRVVLFPGEYRMKEHLADWTKLIPRLPDNQNDELNPGYRLHRPRRLGRDVDTRIAAIIANTTYSHLLFYGTCMPNDCTIDDLQDSLNNSYTGSGVIPWVSACHVDNPQRNFTASDIGFICVVTFLSVLALAASLLDVYIEKSGNTNLTKGWYRFLLPFSAYTNLSKMFQLNKTSSPSNISCLHGMRLIPPMALVAWLNATVVRFFVTGPRSNNWNGYQENCEKNWWKEALFFINFAMEDGSCLGQTWYVSVDAQLYLIAPLLILPLFWYKAAGQAWLYLVTLASALIPAAIIYTRDLPPSSLQIDALAVEYFYDVYLTPWCRAGPYVVGIWLGYIMSNLCDKKVKMNGLMVTVGWTIATLTGLLVVYGMWSYNTLKPNAHYDVMTQLAYGGLSRIAWAAALSWVVFACHYGYGGLVNEFLSHPSWQPLSRLTYATFLVALNIQDAIYYSTRTNYYFTQLNKVVETVGAIAVSLPVAVLVSLLVEAPILGLEKLLLAPRRSQTNKTETLPNPELPLVQDNSSLDSKPVDSPQQFTTAYHNPAFIMEAGGQKSVPTHSTTKF
ncbi:hypothetical protein Pmani_004230 [Petrolisthes manimaculis]|uniref:Nose resistant-to-fluoxetine protein N-terminal domain-containing protein n=1 Tax=Petrolisthes manimaculis TaxID=1843537 RepID=A0AAE1QDX2_9EUCA|nr:hypothetical protein Pmani_004230 [Petrolisthes manimaculis]